nr:alginate biosynthesis TPR repeat lipoprotein AlgK [Pseudomonas sp. RIT-PI-AD]
MLLLALAIGLAGCSGLPDQRLANEALKRGDTATAERNYRQLAELGYVNAQVGLADLQVASGDPEQLREAERTYRQAADQSPRAKARLGRLLAAKPDATDAERREAAQLLEGAFGSGEQSSLMALVVLYMQNPQSFPGVDVQARIAAWRAAGYPQADLAQVLFYRTQGTYDQHLDEIESLCERALAQADVCYVELTTVYQKRAADTPQVEEKRNALLERMTAGYRSGSVPAQRVDSVAMVLADASLGKPDENAAQKILEEIAPAYPASWISLARLLYEYPELGDIDKMMEYLEHGRAADQPRADLLLGKLYYEGKLLPLDPQKSVEHLLKAAPTEPSAHYFLGLIYMRGYLGDIDPPKALEHLLIAARGGQINADYALAQLYSQGKGFVPNPVYAYVFSQLALPKNTPQATELAQGIDQQLQPADRAQAERLLREERQARGSAWQLESPLQAMQTQ